MELGRILQKAHKKYGFFSARYGGDEFVVLCEGKSDAQLRKLAKEAEETIRMRKMQLSGDEGERHVTISQGICNAVPNEETRAEDYLQVADAALYASKEKSGAGAITLRKLPKSGGKK